MRFAILVALALATSGCSLPDLLRSVERFFVGPPKPKAEYCIMTLSRPSGSGIAAGEPVQVQCTPPPRNKHGPARPAGSGGTGNPHMG